MVAIEKFEKALIAHCLERLPTVSSNDKNTGSFSHIVFHIPLAPT